MSAWVLSFLPIQFIMRSYLFEPCCMALYHCASFLCGVLVAVLFAFGFCFLCSFCFACLVGFFAHLHSGSLLDCVLVLRQHYFCGPSLNDGLITMPELMKHVACQRERVNRPDESQEANGRKKKAVVTQEGCFGKNWHYFGPSRRQTALGTSFWRDSSVDSAPAAAQHVHLDQAK